MFKRSVAFTAIVFLTCGLGNSLQSAERPTFNKTCDPRPDILPPPPWYYVKEYRLQYNRPRYVSGWIANKIAPSSQEAMVWCENLRAGAYNEKHMPPRYKRYFGPKPWEVLQTGARPDFADENSYAKPMLGKATPGNSMNGNDESPSDSAPAAPSPTDEIDEVKDASLGRLLDGARSPSDVKAVISEARGFNPAIQ